VRPASALFAVLLTIAPGVSSGQRPRVAALNVTLPAFPSGGAIPAKYACTEHSEDSPNPAIQWSGAPAGTMSFALIMHDTSTPTDFLHWAIFNIPATAVGLREHLPNRATLDDGSVQLKNDAGSPGYYNPCPPGGTHRYQFDLLALDTVLNPPPKNRGALVRAMNGHVIARGQYLGTFGH